MTDPNRSARLGPIELVPGITRGNVLVKLWAAFVGIGALSGISILQSYILNVHMHVPRAEQGTLSGDLAFWTEFIGLLLFVPFGVAADRLGRRAVLVFGFVMVGLGWGLYPFAENPGELLAFRMVYAIGAPAVAGALATLVNDYPADRSRGMLIGITSICNTLGTIFASKFIGSIPDYLHQHGIDAITGGKVMFLTGSVVCLLTAVLAARGLAPGLPAGRQRRPPVGELVRSVLGATRNPRISLAYAGALVARSDVVIKGLFLGLWAIQAGRHEGLSPARAMAQFGTMILIMYGVSLVSAPVFGWVIDRVNRVTALIIALVTASVGYLSMPLVTSPLHLEMAPLLILLTLGTSFMVKATLSLLGQEAPVAERGSIIAGSSFCGALGILVFTAVGGRVFDSWGPWAPFVLAGAYQAVLLVIAIVVRMVAPGPASPYARRLQAAKARA
ncbi:MAG: MFS transporter [Proteobacteria bacterium]|nr:MAG: MFS transporter [Pseudomonadota bacterium]MBC6945845.1 MFS transporter [Gammaproteobacteria bacterium]MCE7895434.1 MFS transporter [Gammaproteobacteria bacterium PRO8]MCQ3933795.1 MFS transporter [Gammaproteobacteria bacterium]MDL1879831.1 MFS transporter [Gammaproteobacteria bacterium PRO2]